MILPEFRISYKCSQIIYNTKMKNIHGTIYDNIKVLCRIECQIKQYMCIVHNFK